VQTAINAILSAASPHSFLGLNMQGRSSVVRTRGNAYGHLVLRGGGDRPNYDSVSVASTAEAMVQAGLADNIVVDCSHANSGKKPERQPLVLRDCVNQIGFGNRSIVGLMVESFLEAGNQPIPADLAQLRYGCSVTDACLDWPTTERMIREARAALKEPLARRLQA
jgi:3-deoxy-7-phosphoheptulonate synthase